MCLGALDLYVDISYHPADRYWLFQWAETGLYVAASGLLTTFGLWHIRRRLS